jgi:hypothetical protein
MDSDTAAVQNVIALQYNPDSLTRSQQIQALSGGQHRVVLLESCKKCSAQKVRYSHPR